MSAGLGQAGSQGMSISWGTHGLTALIRQVQSMKRICLNCDCMEICRACLFPSWFCLGEIEAQIRKIVFPKSHNTQGVARNCGTKPPLTSADATLTFHHLEQVTYSSSSL